MKSLTRKFLDGWMRSVAIIMAILIFVPIAAISGLTPQQRLIWSAGASSVLPTNLTSFFVSPNGATTPTPQTLGALIGKFYNVNARAPQSSDDVTFGPNISPTIGQQSLWNWPGVGEWINIQNAAGQAAWQVVPTSAVEFPLDAVGYPAITVAINSAGASGYTTTSNVLIGNGTAINVTASGGVITAVSIAAGGNWPCTAVASAPTAVAVPGGSGGTVNLTVAGAGVAYGMARLSACYTTNSVVDLALVNNGTVTLKTIGFANGGYGNVVDTAAGDAFCAPSPKSCLVMQWYDQSGNGYGATAPAYAVTTCTATNASATVTVASATNVAVNNYISASFAPFPIDVSTLVSTTVTMSANASQTAAAGTPCVFFGNQPIWSPTNQVGGYRPVAFPSATHAVANCPFRSVVLNVPTLSWSWGRSVLLTIGQTTDNDLHVAEMTSGAVDGYLDSYSYAGVEYMGLNGSGLTGTTVPENTPAVKVFSHQGLSPSGLLTGGRFFAISNNVVAGASHLAAVASTGETIGILSQSTNALNWDGLAYIHYTRVRPEYTNSAMSATDILAARESLTAYFGIVPQYDDVLDVEGDSISNGQGGILDYTRTRYALAFLSRQLRLYNNAVSGWTLQQINTALSARLTAEYSSLYRTFTVEIFAGRNDITINGSTAAQVEGYLQTAVATAKALGANVKVLVATSPVECDLSLNSGYLASIQAYNTWIIANWNVSQANGGLGADGLVNYWADPTIGPGSYPGSGTSPWCSNIVNSPDGVHPTDYYMQFMAPIEATAVNAVLN